METSPIEPLSWPDSGVPSADSTDSPPFPAYVAILAFGALATLMIGNPFAMLVAVLICGGIFTVSVHSARRPVLRHIREQLISRPNCSHLWGTDPKRLELAAFMCQTLARGKDWPNAHFIPTDPIDVAFFEISGVDLGHDIFVVAHLLAQKTGVKFNWDQLSKIRGERPATLADLLEASLGNTRPVNQRLSNEYSKPDKS